MYRQVTLGKSLLFTIFITTPAMFAAKPPASHIVFAGHSFSVEIVSTEVARDRGLMYRTHLASGHGMLFVYPDTQPRHFWMKNTLIPLDILFFDAQRRLINVFAGAPPCKADPCLTYASATPAKYVLELNAGITATLGVKTGETFTLLK